MRKKLSTPDVEVSQKPTLDLAPFISAQDERIKEVYTNLEKQLGIMSAAQMEAIKNAIESSKLKPKTIKVTVQSVDHLNYATTKHYTLKIE